MSKVTTSLSSIYRTHTCNQLRKADENQQITLSGWIHRVRDHGQLVFIDLRDHYGITQCVIDIGTGVDLSDDALKNENLLQIVGKVVLRSEETINSKMSTGEIEIAVEKVTVLSTTEPLPLNVNSDQEFPEETRLTYRFLDLRREKIHNNIVLRSKVIQSIRNRMTEAGFMEIQTPILTSSSPEGARDYLVPSRLHPGHFYALPQAPQQFKQLLMVAGFDRYFQIAPCFRDEDARADRSPGEFYQLDLEMSFVEQEDVLSTIEPILAGIFKEFGGSKKVTEGNFPRISYRESMLKYGSDKPDLRNPLLISDVTSVFQCSDFGIFAKAIDNGSFVRAIPAPNTATKPRSFFDKLNNWARDRGMAGLGYIIFENGEAKGPIAKFLDAERIANLKKITQVQDGDSVFFVCNNKYAIDKNAGLSRTQIAEELDLIEKDAFRFCWVIDYPMYEYDEKNKKIDFSHNPFSMPQGGMEALNSKDPLDILAYQYDIVCNGIELSSGAIRNHKPEIMYKAFEIAGYTKEDVDTRFSGMINAFKYGAPPHGGCAPGIDRMVMLLADEPNIREIIAFPLNQQAQDLMMKAPSTVTEEQLKAVHIQVKVEQPQEGLTLKMTDSSTTKVGA